jgi:hypothetical protein
MNGFTTKDLETERFIITQRMPAALPQRRGGAKVGAKNCLTNSRFEAAASHPPQRVGSNRLTNFKHNPDSDREQRLYGIIVEGFPIAEWGFGELRFSFADLTIPSIFTLSPDIGYIWAIYGLCMGCIWAIPLPSPELLY